MGSEQDQGRKMFFKEHWPEAVALGAGVIAAGIIVLIRHIRKTRPDIDPEQLDELEEEALSGKPDAVLLLDAGPTLDGLTGGQLPKLALEAADSADETRVIEAFSTISSAVQLEQGHSS